MASAGSGLPAAEPQLTAPCRRGATLDLAARSRARNERRRIDYERWTQPQADWEALRGKNIIWRAANQIGKTRGTVKKALNFIRRKGSYRHRRPGPVRVLVISVSKEQMEPLHRKFWELLPRDEIEDGVDFIEGYGFRGKPPRITFKAGEGKGSLIQFATYRQGGQRIAGGTWDVVILDEPVPEKIFGECQPRVLHGDPGEIWISFTVTPESPSQDYLKAKAEAGEVRELVTDLTVANVTFTDGSGALLTQAKIEAFGKDLLPLEREMRLKGGWEPVYADRLLTNWGPHCVSKTRLRPAAGALIAVGIDHGAGAGKQAAVLLAIHIGDGRAPPRIWILEEYVADGYTTPEMDAKAILAMLARRGWDYDHVDYWLGDRPTGMNKFEIRKANTELRIQIARLLGRQVDALKTIFRPYKWSGSVIYGFRLINAVMARKDDDGRSQFLVDAQACPKVCEAAQKWRGAPKDKFKDILDALRYPVEKIVQPGDWFGFRVVYG